MKSIAILPLSFLLLFAFACNFGGKKELNVDEERAKVTELRKELYDNNSVLSSKKVAEEAIEVFRALGKNFPSDSMALPFHIEAAEIAWTLQKYTLSAEIFREIADLHPANESLPYIYVRLGSLYNDKLNDTTMAKSYFNMVIENYPGDEFYQSALFGIETLGMDEDEQFKVILKKQAEAGMAELE